MGKAFFKACCIFGIVLLTAGYAAAEAIKIGALFAVTGPPSFLGEPERNTAQMVVCCSVERVAEMAELSTFSPATAWDRPEWSRNSMSRYVFEPDT